MKNEMNFEGRGSYNTKILVGSKLLPADGITSDELKPEEGDDRGWLYPLPELVREGPIRVRLVEEEKGGKGGRRVLGAWYRDV